MDFRKVTPDTISYEEHCVTGGKSIAVLLQSISGVLVSAINPLVTL
jgi:hypothetical protein